MFEIGRYKNRMKEIVDVSDIAAVVSKWTGIPASKMIEEEAEKLSKMEDALRQRIVGIHPVKPMLTIFSAAPRLPA